MQTESERPASVAFSVSQCDVLQKEGDSKAAYDDVVTKAAICNVRHYDPVDGTLAYAAAGNYLKFFCLNLNGEVRFMVMKYICNTYDCCAI